jgi:hypothetical protein
LTRAGLSRQAKLTPGTRRESTWSSAGFLADGLLIDVRVGARVLDQVVAEGSDVVADEFQDSLAGRGAFLEEIDNP